ncbi:hypothetical protein CALVIDRAFT_602561 [Calocera viscosa TUFC12733]|uniref:Uncharacterized protein n=1 Tax=Calocera viscosa (strain TUFC12733) TaxID=1330018 RepID=A0A167GV28_CALVF|nr:hypothetical protein CALVIDRAFT_602561 [Calocera viscosa TUFC12733]
MPAKRHTRTTLAAQDTNSGTEGHGVIDATPLTKPGRGGRARQPSARGKENNAEDLAKATKKAAPRVVQLDEMRAENAKLQQEKEALQAQMSAARDEVAKWRDMAVEIRKANPKPIIIPRPAGSVGKKNAGGYSLQEAMKLSSMKEEYNSIARIVRDLCHAAQLDCNVEFRLQPAGKLSRIYDMARQRVPLLSRYQDDWATCDLIKIYMRNKRAHMKRRKVARTEVLDLTMDDDENILVGAAVPPTNVTIQSVDDEPELD